MAITNYPHLAPLTEALENANIPYGTQFAAWSEITVGDATVKSLGSSVSPRWSVRNAKNNLSCNTVAEVLVTLARLEGD